MSLSRRKFFSFAGAVVAAVVAPRLPAQPLTMTAGTMDGMPLVSGQTWLFTAQANEALNGIWKVSAGQWSRPRDWSVA